MTKLWLIALFIAGLFGGKAFADCVASPDTPASVIEYFKRFNKPLPEQFCTKEDSAPQASEEPPKSLRKPMRTLPNRPRLIAGAAMLSYPLTTSLFQSRPIPLPMAYGLATLNLAHLVLDSSGSIRTQGTTRFEGHLVRH
jgi:hypothetical protein